MSNLPLADVRVLDLTRLLPGGYATLLMADLGADVVKVEEPERGDYVRWLPPLRDGVSAAHLALNRNKRSIVVDLKSPEGVKVLHRLAARFDVVVESFRPGVLERLGVGWSHLRETNPRLVYCAITGHGQDGPRSQAAGHDINYTGYAGSLAATGSDDGRPAIPSVQVGDLGGGAMAGVIAILAALRARDRTGEGSFCDISMTDGVVSWLGIHVAEMEASGTVPAPGRMMLNGGFPCYRVYPAADGWMAVGALEPQFWAELCRVVERPDLEGDAFATGPRRDEVVADLEALFGRRTRSEWERVFSDLDACVSPIRNLNEMLDDPQLHARGMVVRDHAAVRGGSLIGNPIRVGKGSRTEHAQAPGLGQHTAELLAELDGLDGEGTRPPSS